MVVVVAAVWLRELAQRPWQQCLPALDHWVQQDVGAVALPPPQLAAARAAVLAVVAVAVSPLPRVARPRVTVPVELRLLLEQPAAVKPVVQPGAFQLWQQQPLVAQIKQPVGVAAALQHLTEAVQPLAAVGQQPVAVLPVQQRARELALRQVRRVRLRVQRSPPRPRAHRQ